MSDQNQNRPSQNEILNPTNESTSDNYFEQVTKEYERSIASGEALKNKEELKDIGRVHEKGFFGKVMDAISNPDAAFKWLKYSIMSSLAGSWLGEIFGIDKMYKKLKNEIMGLIDNPVHQVRKILLDFEGFKKLKDVKFDAGDALKKDVFPEKCLNTGELGEVAKDFWKLEKYLAKHPDEVKKAPDDEGELKEWWKKILEKVDLQYSDKVLSVVTKEKTIQQLFPDEEHEARIKNVEMVPFSEAKETYKKSLEEALRPMKQWATEHRSSIEALAILGVTISPAVRTALLSFISGSVMTSAKLAHLCMFFARFGVRHPFVSSLGLGAALLSISNSDAKSKEFMVPKDPKNLKYFFQNKLVQASDVFDTYGLPTIPDEHWDTLSGMMEGDKNTIEQFKESVIYFTEEALTAGVELMTLTPNELILQKNLEGLDSFEYILEDLQIEDEEMKVKIKQALENLELLQASLRNNEMLNEVQIKAFLNLLTPLGIQTAKEGGFITYSIRDAQGVWQKRTLCIDPTVKMDRQIELARAFAVDTSSTFSSLSKLATIPYEQMRLMWDEVLFAGAKSKEDASKLLQRELASKGVILWEGTKAFFVKAGEGYLQKHLIGPKEIALDLLSIIPGGDEFSAMELLVDYAEGLLPVTVFTFATHLSPTKVKHLGFKRILAQTAAYPITGALQSGKFIGNHIATPLWHGKPKEILKDPLVEISSSLKEKWNTGEYFVRDKIPFLGSKSKDIAGISERIADLQKARKLLVRSRYKTILSDAYLEQVRSAIFHSGINTSNFRDSQDRFFSNTDLQEKGVDVLNDEIKKLEAEKKAIKNDILKDKYEKHVEKVKDYDKKVIEKNREFTQRKREIFDRYVSEGKSLSDPEVRKQYIAEVKQTRAAYKQDIDKLFEQRLKSTNKIPESVQIQNKIAVPDVEVTLKNKVVKKVGRGMKGLAGVAATIAAIYGAGELISWAVGENEQLVLDEYFKDTETKENNESVEENKEVMKLVAEYFSSIDQAYNELFNAFSPEAIRDMSKDELRTKVESSVERHKVLIEKVSKFINLNKSSIEKFYRDHPDAQTEKDIGNIMSLGFEEGKVYFKYASSETFQSEMYTHIDYIKDNLEDLLDGKGPSKAKQVWDQAQYAIPLRGTYLDAEDAIEDFQRGNYVDAAKSGLWATVGGVSDALLFIPVVGWMGSAVLKSARVARTTTAIGRTVGTVAQGAARLGQGVKAQAMVGKITWGMIGADMLRPFFKPEKDQTYYFS